MVDIQDPDFEKEHEVLRGRNLCKVVPKQTRDIGVLEASRLDLMPFQCFRKPLPGPTESSISRLHFTYDHVDNLN